MRPGVNDGVEGYATPHSADLRHRQLALGLIGVFLPLLPTVPFVLLAAWCFARSSPRLEHWLLEHKRYGPHIRAWRTSRSISRSGEYAVWIAFAVSATVGLLALPAWWKPAPPRRRLRGQRVHRPRATTPEGGPA